MTLEAGSRLGPYEILAPIGAGGMGEVYRARDTRLERAVAIKVLPQNLSSSPEVRQRFEREAKTISQLSHPHICALYDVGREGEIEFLVMELLEGETLSDRLGRGPLPLEQTLRYGIEIADALDRAHRQGIVHRDLKPGNVMLTKAGVKLLDFGLAKVMAPASPPSALTSLPTMAGGRNLTQEGTILGTFQYMAPEQLEGKEADGRTDIFAFGALLYEMATGRKAFSGTSQASLISSIMSSEPPAVSAVQPMTPPALDRVVRTCLAKDPEERWQSAADIKRELRWISEGSAAGVAAPVVLSARRRNRERLAWTVAAALFVLAALATWGWVSRAPRPQTRVSAFVLPPDKSELALGEAGVGALSVSADGRLLTFAAKGDDGKVGLWLRRIDELAAKPISGTSGATFPFWSPDGRFLAFFADGKLQKVDVSGAPPLPICDAPTGRSGSWNRDGVIIFSPTTTDGIYRVPAAGGPATPVTALDPSREETTHRWATFLPDGRHFLYMAGSHSSGTKSGANAVFVADLDSKEKTLLLQARSNVVYASGYLLYMRERILLAQRFDAGSRRLVGEPIPVADDVKYDLPTFRGAFAASETGTLLYALASGGGNKSRLLWMDRSGKRLGEPFGEPAEYASLAVSPDGKRIAAGIDDPATGTPSLWILDQRGGRSRLTTGAPADQPVWSPDGKVVAYQKLEKGVATVCVRPADGTGQEDVVYRSKRISSPASWSPDGKFLAIDLAPDGQRKGDIWMMNMSGDGDHKAFPFLAGEAFERAPGFSPDGRWVCYMSDESGRFEVYVVPFPGPGGKWQISTNGAAGGGFGRPNEVIYGTLEGEALSVEIKAGPDGIQLGQPKSLFHFPQFAAISATPDAERILFAIFPEVAAAPRLALMTNWTAGLEKK